MAGAADDSRVYPVTILTHEGGGGPPYEQTLSQMLTDFFCAAEVGVHTMMLAKDLMRMGESARLTLVLSNLHKKECVQKTVDMKNKTTDVPFVQSVLYQT
jgi:hypothetical protein